VLLMVAGRYSIHWRSRIGEHNPPAPSSTYRPAGRWPMQICCRSLPYRSLLTLAGDCTKCFEGCGHKKFQLLNGF